MISNPKLEEWKPIGTSNNPFKGTFDGQGHTISGLYVNLKKNYVGLFGHVGKGGTVKNVTLADSYVSGNISVGGICGWNDGGTVENCTSGCTVKGTGNSVGGICGFNDVRSQLKNCHNTGKVSGDSNVGGVCGWNEYSILQESYNTGEVSGNTYVGGVCGQNHSGTVKRCYNTVEVSGESNVGGVCGCNISGAVQESYNTGEVFGNNNFVGGVCGQNRGNVKGCYNTGKVTGKSQVGGVCGGTSSTGCYYLDTSGTDSQGESKTELQFKNGEVAYLLQKALDDAAIAANKPTTQVWGQRIGTGVTDDYPVLSNDSAYTVYPEAASSPCKGYSNTPDQKFEHQYDKNGVCSTCGGWEAAKQAADGYYEITNQGKLYWFAKKVRDGETNINARLMDNITINSGVLNNGELNTGANFTPWTPIGTEAQPFTGTFDGNNKTIGGLYIDGTADYVGLFGCIGKSSTATGTVQKVTLADSYVRGNENVGGICGYNNGGTLQDCHNTGTVSGTTNVGGVCGKNSSTLENSSNTGKVSGTGEHVGGVCGLNDTGGTVKGCYNTTGESSGTGEVTGKGRFTGGVCGYNFYGTVQECYNNGKVSGTDSVGGVCGKNRSTLEKSYNTGKVIGTGDDTGGVCGYNDAGNFISAGGTVKGCYNTGEVTGTKNVGGVCGYNEATVENCYYLTGTSAKAVGDGTGVSTNCASKTELQFQNGAVVYQLQSDLGEGAEQVWGQRIDTGTGETDKTPVLSSDSTYAVHPAATGSICKRYSNKPDQKFDSHQYDEETRVCSRCGESEQLKVVDGYYEIYNQDQLREFANLINTTSNGETKINARLMNDITMDGTEWTPIGTDEHPFTGTFDGNSKTITGLKCTDTSAYYVGLVGYASGATIQNVTVQESSLSGKEDIGGVCGYIKDGTITNCHAVKTAIGDSRGFAEFKDYGGIVGHITGETTNVTDCTNSDGTVNGGYDLGGIVGFAGSYTTVQRCFNSGAVTGQYGKFGGIVGQAKYVTVQDCGNTGAVRPADGYDPVYYGGIIGENLDGSTIENCYNTDSNTADKIYGSYFCDYRNCYYLTNNPGSSGSTDPNITAKTAEQFASGEVAYLLQNGHGDTAVWGQTIGKDKYPKLGGDKVYQSAPCTADYSNTEIPPKQHVIGNDGKCTNCGAQCIAYTVTIPATVELGTTATIKAKDVILPNGKTLNVKVAEGSEFEVAQADDNDAVVDKCAYTVTKGETKTPVNPSDTVLTVVNGVAESSVKLQFNKPETTTYSGEYKGKVTFTVSVDDKPAS